jgi:hypothetical protein
VRRDLLAPALCLGLGLGLGVGCFRLSDPFYAMKDIHADEPKHEGSSLLLGTIEVEAWMTGDLNTVNLVRLGPGKERAYYGANRINLFRVFSPRTMKDGNFIIEVDPGVYELQNFTTSGWGQPQTWNAREEARKGTRVMVTRPGVYDIGTIRVERGEGLSRTYAMERSAESTPERREVFARALAGTRWERLAAPASAP